MSLLATANSFHGSEFSWISIFLTSFLFRHAIFERRDIFLLAAADFPLDPLFPGSLPSNFWGRSAATLQTLRRFLGPPTGITKEYSLGIS
jgi:hypothetical protein